MYRRRAVLVHGIQLDSPAIQDFCRRWRLKELCVFGSVLREDFRLDSDVDFLVQYEDGAEWQEEDLLRMEEQLGAIVGRKADVLERQAVEKSANYIRRKHILGTALRIHAQGTAHPWALG